MPALQEKRIVITGIGPIGSPGIGKDSFWRGVVDQEIGLEKVFFKLPGLESNWFYLHKVKGFNVHNFGIDENDLTFIKAWKEKKENKDLNFMLAATKLALDDSSINYHVDKSLGLVVSHENPCLEQLLKETFSYAHQLREKPSLYGGKHFLEQLFQKTVRTAYETQPFMLLFHIAKVFKIHNFVSYVNNACSSGLHALELASDAIKLGKVSKVIVVAGDCPDIFKLLWFKLIGMYEEDGRIKPFAANAGGFVLGEGATGIVLEDYNVAIKRRARIYAEYLGGGFRLEGWKVMVPNITENYLGEAINDALKKRKVKKSSVDLICAHGVGTAVNDFYEARAIAKVFSALRTPVTALKPYVGHNLGGCALLELALLLLAMQNDQMMPTLNTEAVDPRFDINLLTENRIVSYKTILKISSAFAGYQAAAIFQKVQ